MTNNPTIDGVSRVIALFESIIGKNPDAFLHEPVYQVTESEVLEFASQISAPAVERQEPVPKSEWDVPSNPVIGYADSYRAMARQGVKDVQVWSVITDLERNIAPVVAALQSRIAQLEAEAMYAAAGYKAARARIEELESVRGQPIYQVEYRGEGGGGWIDAEKESYDAKIPHPKHWKTRIVYAAPPVSVAVVLPERKQYVGQGVYPDAHEWTCANSEVSGWNSFLDATAALNGGKS